MYKTLLEGLALGFSTGSICLATCTPIYLPYLLSEDRKLGKNFLLVLEISLGRFFSYLAFGAAAGFIGNKIAAIDRSLYTSIAYIFLSLFLILSAIRTHKKHKKCHIPKLTTFTKSAFLLGILTGINFCPSFLIALSKAIDLAGVVSGMMLFLGFFFGTSVFLLPLALMGQLTRIKKLKLLAQIASIIIAIWFTYSGIKGIINFRKMRQLEKQPARIIETFHPQKKLMLICKPANKKYFKTLQDSLQKRARGEVEFRVYHETLLDTLSNISQLVLFRDLEVQDKAFNKFDQFVVEPQYPIAKLNKFLHYYSFKTRKKLRWEFIEEKSE